MLASPLEAGGTALLSVGEARTALHPAVVRSFHTMASSLPRATTFLVLSPLAPNATAQLRALYRPAALAFLHPVPCASRCAVPCALGHDAPMQFVEMATHLRQGWRLLLQWEERVGARFEWVLKVRPDLLWLEPFPLGQLMPSLAVPRGVMTSSAQHLRLNDHVLWCARQRCAPYFEELPARYERDCAFRLPSPPQRALFDGGGAALLDVAYTIARRAGPECARLTCGSHPIHTGCVAPHLPRFAPACAAIARAWGMARPPGLPTLRTT
ncbi:hypothetical protein AB1Y20_010936 [Prymnesium parvum]|uniref:Uncharacterized protein n=1 Tax=Prymnesium parvum TaxID=97485 RepID=A0AB34ISU1_PRYPA